MSSSTFAALNLSDELTAQDAEEHTRELQIEEAFKVFQKVLNHQKESQFTEARAAYKELFAIEVVSGDNKSFTSPTIRTLRYLAHRNRGLLFFQELKHKINDLPSEDLVSLLNDSVDDLIEALQHTEGDTMVVNLLLGLFKFFDNVRLARFIVEYELDKEDDDVIVHKKKKLQARDLVSHAIEEKLILSKLGFDVGPVDEQAQKLVLPDMSFLEPVKKYIEEQSELVEESHEEVVKVDENSLKDVGIGLFNVCGKNKTKNVKLRDWYLTMDKFITKITFEVYESKEPTLKRTETTEETPKAQPESTSEDDHKRAASDEPPQQRASKRVRTLDDTDTLFKNALEYSQRFMNSFNHLVSDFGLKLPSYGSTDKLTTDFLNCLNNWSSKHTEALFQSSATSTTDTSLADVIDSDEVAGDGNGVDTQSVRDASARIINVVNSSQMSYTEARLVFLREIMRMGEDGKCLIIDTRLDRDLFQVIESFVFFVELDLKSDPTIDVSFKVAIFEVLVNFWITIKQQTKQNSKNWGEAQNLDAIESAIRRWSKELSTLLTGCSTLSLRWRWCSALFLQKSQSADYETVCQLLEELRSDLVDFSPELVVNYCNFDSIPPLSDQSIKNQRDKLEVVSIFEKALQRGDSDEKETASLLEQMLLSPQTESPTSMEKFIRDCPLGIKLRLWKTLLDYYVKESELERYNTAMNVLLPLLYDSLVEISSGDGNETQRHQALVTTLGYYGRFIEGFVMISKRLDWKTPSKEADSLNHIGQFFGLLYCYCLYERMGLDSKSPSSKPPTPSKSVSKLKDMIADTLVMLLLFFNVKVEGNDELSLDLLSILHEEIGMLHFCDAASGRFLEFSQRLLRGTDVEKFEVDIVQHLNCRFHISISTEKFTPFNHETKPVDLDKESAFQFSEYLFGVLSRKKDPLVSQLRPDLKSAMDVFFTAVGEPDETNHTVQRNKAELARFLEQQIDARVFRDAFRGSLRLNLKVANVTQKAVAEKGLYYFQGAASLNIYKSRKRLAQGKSSDLEQVISLLSADVLSGTARVETWLLLGDAYSLQVEDDLVWTSDRLNSLDRKFAVASTQRMSLLCYCMALSMFVSVGADPAAGTILFGNLSRELYHSLMRPMDGFCYLGVLEKKVLTADGLKKVQSSISPEKHIFILKLVFRLVKMALSCDPSSWTHYYYLAKVMHKLSAPPPKVINASLKSCNLSSGALEPHYQLCTLLYKYVKSNQYPESKAIAKLKEASELFGDIEPDEEISDQFTAHVVSALRKLTASDKKKWHHKPKYRLAKIMYELGYFQRAYEELDGFVLAKSSNKNLIHIWKPDFETPGKHFVYTHIYACFYLDILWKLADFNGLILFMRKLRRFGTGMVDLPEAWEKACFIMCHMLREIMKVPKGFTDVELAKLNFSEFQVTSQKLTDILKAGNLDEADESLLVLLFEILEMRRMNNGFGPTSFVDDTFIALYLRLFQQKSDAIGEVEVPVSDQKTPTKTRVARRDILSTIVTMLKVLEDKVKKQRISDEMQYAMPDHMLPASERGEIVGDPTYADGSGYRLELPEVPEPPQPTTPPTTELADGDDNTDEFHTPMQIPVRADSAALDVDSSKDLEVVDLDLTQDAPKVDEQVDRDSTQDAPKEDQEKEKADTTKPEVIEL